MINKYQRRVSRVPVIRDQWSDHYHSFWFFHVSCFPINSFRVYLIGAVSIITFMSIAIPLRICAFSFCHQLNYTLQNWGIESESSRNKWSDKVTPQDWNRPPPATSQWTPSSEHCQARHQWFFSLAGKRTLARPNVQSCHCCRCSCRNQWRVLWKEPTSFHCRSIVVNNSVIEGTGILGFDWSGQSLIIWHDLN